jgi:hypothetical protein
MGKQAQQRKKRRLAAEAPVKAAGAAGLDVVEAISDADLKVTVATLGLLANSAASLEGVRFKGLRTMLHSLAARSASLANRTTDALRDSRWQVLN